MYDAEACTELQIRDGNHSILTLSTCSVSNIRPISQNITL